MSRPINNIHNDDVLSRRTEDSEQSTAEKSQLYHRIKQWLDRHGIRGEIAQFKFPMHGESYIRMQHMTAVMDDLAAPLPREAMITIFRQLIDRVKSEVKGITDSHRKYRVNQYRFKRDADSDLLGPFVETVPTPAPVNYGYNLMPTNQQPGYDLTPVVQAARHNYGMMPAQQPAGYNLMPAANQQAAAYMASANMQQAGYALMPNQQSTGYGVSNYGYNPMPTVQAPPVQTVPAPVQAPVMATPPVQTVPAPVQAPVQTEEVKVVDTPASDVVQSIQAATPTATDDVKALLQAVIADNRQTHMMMIELMKQLASKNGV